MISEAADACAAVPLLRIPRINGLNQHAHTAASLLCARVLCATAEGGGDIAATPAPPLVDAAVGWMKINLEKHGSTRADTGILEHLDQERDVRACAARREQTRGARTFSIYNLLPIFYIRISEVS